MRWWGRGSSRRCGGWRLSLREMVEGLDVPVVAVDLPSGWDADSMEQTAEGAFRADAVVTFTAPKMAHVFGHLTRNAKTAGRLGRWWWRRLGRRRRRWFRPSGLTWTGASKVLRRRPRDVNSNKGKFGHVLVVGGSYGKAGAPAMASLAGLRTGAGLVTAAVPKSIVNTVARIAPELMMAPLAEGIKGAVVVQESGWGEAGRAGEEDHRGGGGAGAVDGGRCVGVCAAGGGEDDGADGDRCGCAECV